MMLSQTLRFLLALVATVNVAARLGDRQIVDPLDQVRLQTALEPILNPPFLTLLEEFDPFVNPLPLCAGDCDDDEDCMGDLVCTQRSEGDPVPGCRAVNETDYDTSDDYCTFPPIQFIGTGPGDRDTEQFPNGWDDIPLGLCYGDCDRDSDCAEGLVCFQRDSRSDVVPGCSGLERFREEVNRPSDFCVKAIFDNAYSAFGIVQPTDPPTGQPMPTQQPSMAPSISPFTLAQVGNNGFPQEFYPLAVCKGDCDNDEECGLGLVCFRRNDEDIPSCLGEPLLGVDYCIPDPDYVALPLCDTEVDGVMMLEVNGTITENCTTPMDMNNTLVDVNGTEYVDGTVTSVAKKGGRSLIDW